MNRHIKQGYLDRRHNLLREIDNLSKKVLRGKMALESMDDEHSKLSFREGKKTPAGITYKIVDKKVWGKDFAEKPEPVYRPTYRKATLWEKIKNLFKGI